MNANEQKSESDKLQNQMQDLELKTNSQGEVQNLGSVFPVNKAFKIKN